MKNSFLTSANAATVCSESFTNEEEVCGGSCLAGCPASSSASCPEEEICGGSCCASYPANCPEEEICVGSCPAGCSASCPVSGENNCHFLRCLELGKLLQYLVQLG